MNSLQQTYITYSLLLFCLGVKRINVYPIPLQHLQT